MKPVHGPDVPRSKGRPRNFDREHALVRALEIFWKRGYEPASIAELCQAMEINPPSLYATFGNKAKLFIEAVHYYEKRYWSAIAQDFKAEHDLFRAVDMFFRESARILLSPDSPCGCMVVLAAINIADEAEEVIAVIRELRLESKQMFADKLQEAVKGGQISKDADILALSGALNTMLEGLSLQARDGLSLAELESIASCAVRLLPRGNE